MRNLLLLGFAVLMLSSCSKNLVPYSANLPESNGWSESQIERIQFYTSDDIVLYREVSESDTRIAEGKIKFENGREIEEVVIRKGTPGVAIWQEEDQRYGIALDKGSEQFLTFGPNPERKRRYYLLASDWEGKVGTVTYNGIDYKTSQQSANVYLMVDMRKIRKTDVNSKVARGRTVK